MVQSGDWRDDIPRGDALLYLVDIRGRRLTENQGDIAMKRATMTNVMLEAYHAVVEINTKPPESRSLPDEASA